MVDAAIIGAGISGLTAAFEMILRGRSVLLFEANGRCGGVIDTLQKDGFRLELGPNTLMLRDSGRTLLRQLGLEPARIDPAKKTRFVTITENGSERLVPLNFSALTSGSILSAGALLRLLAEPFIPRTAHPDLTVHQFIERRFGVEPAAKLASPFFNGVYAASTQEISARTALRTIWDFEQRSGSVTAGALCAVVRKLFTRRRRGRTEIVNFDGGMQALVSEIVKHIDVSLRLNTGVRAITPTPNGVEIETSAGSHAARQVVLTGNAQSTAQLLAPIDPLLAERISQISYAPVGLLYVSCKASDLSPKFDGLGFLRPPKHGEPLLGALFSSAMFPACVPAGRALLTCFVGGSLNPGLSDPAQSETQRKAIDSLRSLLEIGGDLDILHTQHWPRAIPRYNLGHSEIERELAEFEKRHPRIRTIANWVRKPGVADCIERGIAASESGPSDPLEHQFHRR